MSDIRDKIEARRVKKRFKELSKIDKTIRELDDKLRKVKETEADYIIYCQGRSVSSTVARISEGCDRSVALWVVEQIIRYFTITEDELCKLMK